MSRRILAGTAAYIITVVFLVVILVISALIPHELLKDNMEASAEFLNGTELFDDLWEGVPSSRIDHYADSILLGIAWQYQDSHPFRSVMESSFYRNTGQYENDDLYDAVTSDLPANQEYIRYWHGSIVLVRPLLVLMSLRGIRFFGAIVLGLLFIWLIIRLVRLRESAFAMGILLGSVSTFSWFVPLCLEYIWVYLIMLVSSHIILSFADDMYKLVLILMVSGIVCAYMDFLTAETLTLTVPLMLGLCRLSRSDLPARELVKGYIYAVFTWGLGYAGMFAAKWILASITLRKNVMPYVLDRALERTSGLVLDEAYFRNLGPIFKNAGCLIPFCFGTAGMIIAVLILLILLYSGYVYGSKNARLSLVCLYAVTGLIPMIRYIVLRNHSVIHFFFTFRAMLATIIALCLIAWELFFAHRNLGSSE